MGLEQRIAQRLRELSDTQLDRVACAYAALRFPQRFRFVDGRGFNAFDKPIGGRPDAFVVAADGTLDRIEVTGYKEKSKIKTADLNAGHFVDKLRSIQQRYPAGNAGGLLYVAGHPDIQFDPQEIEQMRNAAEAAGLAIDLVQIVGGDALKEALAAAEFAAVRIRLLGIEDPKRFTLVQPELGPDRRRLKSSNPFIPSVEDLEAGRVHFPAAGREVEARLKSDKLCLVKGVGASGKSVLAWLVGLRWGAAAAPAFVFNLQDATDDRPAAIRGCAEDLKVHASADALFIVDNVHLDEEGAREIYLEWRRLPPLQQPALLLLGRETRDRAGTSLEWLPTSPIILRAREPELEGVFRRLVRRNQARADPELPAPRIPRADLSAWLSTFGGNPDDPSATADLILFSAAVQRRMDELLAGDYRLTEQDAADEALKHYIRPLTHEERENLLELSVFQKLEITFDSRYLLYPFSALEECTEGLGIVFEVSLFKRRYKHFVSAHSSLSQLILTASGRGSSYEMSVFARHAKLSDRGPRNLVRGLLKAGRSVEAEKVQSMMMCNCDVYRDTPLVAWLQIFRSASASRDSAAIAHFNTWVTGQKSGPALTAAAHESPLNDLTPFLRYLEGAKAEQLRGLYLRIASALAAQPSVTTLTAKAVKTPLNDLTQFLRYLEGASAEQLRDLYSRIASALAAQINATALTANAVKSPLIDLTQFLRYLEGAKAEQLRGLYSPIALALAAENNLSTLAANAAKSPLNDLTQFLRYLEGAKAEQLRSLYCRIAVALAAETNVITLAANAVENPVELITYFLGYLERAQSKEAGLLNNMLIRALRAPPYVGGIATTALQGPPEHFSGFVKFAVARDWLDPITKAIVDQCPAGSPHAEILLDLSAALQMEAEVLIELGQTHIGRAKQSRLSRLFRKFVESD